MNAGTANQQSRHSPITADDVKLAFKSSELYFEPLWQRMGQKLIQEDILHADETELRVLHEPDRKA